MAGPEHLGGKAPADPTAQHAPGTVDATTGTPQHAPGTADATTEAVPAVRPPLPDGVAADLILHFGTNSLFPLRSAVAAHASHLGLTGTRVDDMVLVAHELAANAVRHGDGRGHLVLWRDGDGVYCRVSDDGCGIADPVDAGRELPNPYQLGGRGLWMVRRLCDDFRIDSDGHGTTVTVSMRVG